MAAVGLAVIGFVFLGVRSSPSSAPVGWIPPASGGVVIPTEHPVHAPVQYPAAQAPAHRSKHTATTLGAPLALKAFAPLGGDTFNFIKPLDALVAPQLPLRRYVAPAPAPRHPGTGHPRRAPGRHPPSPVTQLGPGQPGPVPPAQQPTHVNLPTSPPSGGGGGGTGGGGGGGGGGSPPSQTTPTDTTPTDTTPTDTTPTDTTPTDTTPTDTTPTDTTPTDTTPTDTNPTGPPPGGDG